MSELDVFRLETREWLETHCPEEMRRPMTDEADICWGGKRFQFQSEAQRVWLDRMSARGWTAPTWPAAYGGGGLDAERARVLGEEMAQMGCRTPLHSFGILMLGPALLAFGTEEQKQRFLPPIVRGETRWCQGYSEPNAGSDLASLTTGAKLDDNEFVVNGQKTWTSYADQADWMFCLVRTDTSSKQGGISFLLIDMTSPGVTVRPIRMISGKSPFCETFLDNVRVPRENLVGELNGGWRVAKHLLVHERAMIGGSDQRGPVPILRDEAMATAGRGVDGRLGDPMLRAAIAGFEVDEAAFGAWSRACARDVQAGRDASAAASGLKLYGSELNKRRWDLMMTIGGADALEWDSRDSLDGLKAKTWLRSKAASIYGGSSEIQLNLLAKRVLGLPTG